MSQGRDSLLLVSDDGTATGTPVEIENQGDLTINFGKTNNTTVYKNGQTSNQNDAGKSVSISMGLTAPIGAGQSALIDLDESGAPGYFWITHKVTGGIQFEFAGITSVASLTTPTNGDGTVQVQVGVVGDWTRSVAT